jgi:YfiR/HmsC-like
MKAMRYLAALMVTTLSLSVLVPTAEASETREYAVKAAYLFKFMNLIEWPNEDKISKFVVGVVGPGPFGPSLDDIDGKLVRGKPLTLVTYPMVKSPAPTEQMILFIDRANDNKLEKLVAELKGQNVLTVGESKKFAERGGCINLVTVNNRVRFRINVDAVRRAQLKISPRLVKVASVLVTDSGKKASYDEYEDILAHNL